MCLTTWYLRKRWKIKDNVTKYIWDQFCLLANSYWKLNTVWTETYVVKFYCKSLWGLWQICFSWINEFEDTIQTNAQLNWSFVLIIKDNVSVCLRVKIVKYRAVILVSQLIIQDFANSFINSWIYWKVDTRRSELK